MQNRSYGHLIFGGNCCRAGALNFKVMDASVVASVRVPGAAHGHFGAHSQIYHVYPYKYAGRSNKVKKCKQQLLYSKPKHRFIFSGLCTSTATGHGGNNGFNDGGGAGGRGGDDNDNENEHEHDGGFIWKCCCAGALVCLCSACVLGHTHIRRYLCSLQGSGVSNCGAYDVVWEIESGQKRRLVLNFQDDGFVLGAGKQACEESQLSESEQNDAFTKALTWCRGVITQLMLPEGYPESVTDDYLEYSVWRMLQSIASQVNGVLSTQALLYAVGLGKGAIPAAAAVNWVLKDGIGYLSKIRLSKYGRNFDVHPKGWRLFADILENASYGLELLTPVFPQCFVILGSAAGAGRSAAALIQAATRTCFYAGFAAQHNFAEVIAKGEAQGMVSKSLGILFGVGVSSYAGSSGILLLGTFALVTGIHMFCNFKSYQAIQLRTLNPYRASLIFAEYFQTGCIPSVKDVNKQEPLFTCSPFTKSLSMLSSTSERVISPEAIEAALELPDRVQLGCKFDAVIRNPDDADTLCELYKNEQYLLLEDKGRYLVLLKSGASAVDTLKALLQASYLYDCERNVGAAESSGAVAMGCAVGNKLAASYDFMVKEFGNIQSKIASRGWHAQGLVAMPLPYRLTVTSSC